MAAPRKAASKRSSSQRGTTSDTAKKSATTKKAAARKAPQKRTAPSNGSGQAKKATAMQVARSAAQQLAQLTGRIPECVTGIERTEEGWQVELEVVESRRIPDSTDVLATYVVQADGDGDLMGYHRASRYLRGKSGDRGGS